MTLSSAIEATSRIIATKKASGGHPEATIRGQENPDVAYVHVEVLHRLLRFASYKF
jgi:hypothetical protein